MTCYNISVGQGAPCASGCGPVPTENRQPSHVYRDNSMAALPYIQLHIAEYLADTAHLTPTQHGAYLLLIFNYWQRAESLNNSNERLACVARMSNSEWAENRGVLAEFFEVSGDRWVHPRIERDLTQVNEKIAKKSMAGKASAKQAIIKRSTDDEQVLNTCPTNKIREDKDSKPLRAKDALDDVGKPIPQNQSHSKPDDFDQFWSAYPTKVGKEAARKAWGRAKQKPSLETILQALTKQKTSARWTKEGGQYIPNPATWINQGRWADEIEEAPVGSPIAGNGAKRRFQRTHRGWEQYDDEYGWYVVHESDVPPAEIDRILRKTEIIVSDSHPNAPKEAI